VREIVYGYYNKVGNQSLSLFRNGGAVKISNREARSYVQNRTPFRANNLSGENYGDIYVVKSYGYYPIFVYKDGVWYENSNKYSSSTAKQMGQSRPSADTVKVSKAEIEGMYADGGNLASGWSYSIGGL